MKKFFHQIRNVINFYNFQMKSIFASQEISKPAKKNHSNEKINKNLKLSNG